MKDNDSKFLAEAYSKVNENYGRYDKRPVGNYAETSDDFEFVYNGKSYMASISYDITETLSPGDYDTPDYYDYDVEELEMVELYVENPETGEYEPVTQEQNPEAWAEIKKFAEQKFLDDRSNWDSEY
jgi:hypothetical protein